MSLLGQTARYLLLSALVIAALGSVGFYVLIHRQIQHEVDEILANRVEHVRLQLGRPTDSAATRQLTAPTSNPRTERVALPEKTRFSDAVQIDSLDGNRRIDIRQLEKTVTVDGQHYRVTTYEPYFEFNELTRELSGVVILAFLLLMGLSVGVGLGLARRLWRPFHATVDQLPAVQFDTGIQPVFPISSVREFNLLSRSLTDLTRKLRRQFLLQKQFTENASHELQTPLAVAAAELDHLMQSEHLNATDHRHLQQVSSALNRMSQLSRSLLLLTQVENNQFADADTVDLSALLHQFLGEYEPFFTHKNIALTSCISPGVLLSINRQLATILLTNLLKNAVRHGESDGRVQLALTPDLLTISNTGAPLPFADSLLFTRFVRNPARPDSTGLGLALIRQIADRYQLPLAYQYDPTDRMHTFRLGLR
ncbi:sensor histidine kinase [Spirosoma rhododendri]|uniref:histidine kinase n=1 Tax=Spirosoma rhododendri TaxID=2728024 RepID=A0A7L5DRT8_9BACT|nr:HAMP domain-containing sensor histidine kinase [Spirosoma rhododendri]QJD81136.1 HAMP domain-containing histidine kinase [Spirosoma rhododendri]